MFGIIVMGGRGKRFNYLEKGQIKRFLTFLLQKFKFFTSFQHTSLTQD